MSKPPRDNQFREIGRPIRRKEDHRLLTGQGAFSDDFVAPGQLCAVMVRSPYPHARIRSIHTPEVLAMDGVRLVLTGANCLAAGMSGIPHNPIPKTNNDLKLRGPGGSDIFIGPHIPLPTDKVRHVGEAVAMIIAETPHQAMDAAEIMEIDYEELPWVTDTAAAAEAGSPTIWEQSPTNTPVDTLFGDPVATEAAFARAAEPRGSAGYLPDRRHRLFAGAEELFRELSR